MYFYLVTELQCLFVTGFSVNEYAAVVEGEQVFIFISLIWKCRNFNSKIYLFVGVIIPHVIFLVILQRIVRATLFTFYYTCSEWNKWSWEVAYNFIQMWSILNVCEIYFTDWTVCYPYFPSVCSNDNIFLSR